MSTVAGAERSVARVEPMGLGRSLLYFGVPAAIFTASLFLMLPWLVASGASPFVTFTLVFGLPLALMLMAAVIAYRLEGRPPAWPAFRERMRLDRLDSSVWAWGIVVGASSFLIGPLLRPFAGVLSQVRFYTPPAAFSSFMGSAWSGSDTFLGISLAGQWWVIVYYAFLLLVLNILGEELWWRGYILPRQEAAHASRAWIVNGTLWAAFHIYYHATLFSFVAMLPGTLFLAYACQRTRSTWTGIIAHTITNGAWPVMIVRGVLGT